MPEIPNPADEWVVTPIAEAESNKFVNYLQTESYWGLSALGVLHAVQQHADQHPAFQEATLIHTHPDMTWPTQARQLKQSLQAFGFLLRLNPSIDDMVQKGHYAYLSGGMPTPHGIVTAPGLAFLQKQLAYYRGKGGVPHGCNYIRFSPEQADQDRVVFGFANPTARTRMEHELQLTALKEKHPFPPPRIQPPKGLFQL